VPRNLLSSRRRTDRVERLAATGLAAGRLAIGAGLWCAPRLSLRALGFGDPSAPSVAVTRIAATRDLVLGAWQLRSAGDRRELRRATVAVAIADAGDTLVFALALRSPETRTAGLRGLPGAAPATALGAWLAARLRG
jgi:hypothetical protein